jgi:adenylate kinase family enzyme
MLTRTIIIGNSGSGKSWLAKSLSVIHSVPVICLDRLFWLPGGFNRKRAKEEIQVEIKQKLKGDSWIVEGVFGELAEMFLLRTQSLIFLDMNWKVCRAGLWARGSDSSQQLEPVKAENNFQNLLVWAEEYWTRTDLRSYSGHFRLFSNFTDSKYRFSSHADVETFLKQQRTN